MTPDYRLATICRSSHLERLLSVAPQLAVRAPIEDVVILDGPPPDRHCLATVSLDVVRLLDVNYLVFGSDDMGDRMLVERALFDMLPDHYEAEINVANNVTNLRTLFQLCLGDDLTTRAARVLDFGCGTGLSRLACPQPNIAIVGCDVSVRMLERAATRLDGIVTPDALRAEIATFTSVICGYVLHLTIPPGDLLEAIRLLEPRGRIAANFHKGVGLETTNAVLVNQAHMSALHLSGGDSGEHGPYGVWQKV